MALHPYHYIDPKTNDFHDAYHSAMYLSFIAECAERMLESDLTNFSPAGRVQNDAEIDALGDLINHNATTHKLACLQIPELKSWHGDETHADERMARLLAVRA